MAKNSIERTPAKRGEAQSRQAPAPKPVPVTVNTGYTDFACSAFFNRFVLEENEGHALMHFGTVSKGSTLHAFTAAISKQDLAKVRERLANYIASLESVPDKPETEWTPPPTARPAALARIINCARADHDAEILLYSFSLHQLLSANRLGKESVQPLPIDGAPVAHLTCSIETQKAFLMALLSLA